MTNSTACREAVAWAWRTRRGLNEWTYGWALSHVEPTRENCYLKEVDEIEVRPLGFIDTRATEGEAVAYIAPDDDLSIPYFVLAQEASSTIKECWIPLYDHQKPKIENTNEQKTCTSCRGTGVQHYLMGDVEMASPCHVCTSNTHPSATSAEVERDAARYRWLRENAYEYDDGLVWPNREFHFVESTGVIDLDKTIDAALAELGERHDDAL